jgi:hypothetical protein
MCRPEIAGIRCALKALNFGWRDGLYFVFQVEGCDTITSAHVLTLLRKERCDRGHSISAYI